MGDAELASDRLRGDLVVASQHDNFEARSFECLQRLRRRGLDRVGNGEKSCERTIECNKNHGRPIFAQPIRFAVQGLRVDSGVRHDARITDCHALTANEACHAFAGGRVKIINCQ